MMKSLACALIASMSLASAQSQAQSSDAGAGDAAGRPTQASPKAVKSKPSADLLAGPKVEPEAQGRGGSIMGGGEGGGARRQQQRDVPIQQWLNILRSLDITAEQQAKFRTIMQEFRAANETFRREHGQELRQLEAEIGPMRQPQDPQQPVRPRLREARQRMASMQESAPKVQEYQLRIWDELTEQQREQMRARLDEAEKRMRAARERQAMPMTGDSTDKMQQGGSDEQRKAEDSKRTKASEVDAQRRPQVRPDDGAEDEPQRRRQQERRRRAAAAERASNTGQPSEHDRKFKFDD